MLKSLLSLLLSKFYSKKESSLVAHQAMPNFENAVALSLTTGNDGTYVAPADGYINVEVESSGYVNFWGGILDSASNGLWNKVAVPVSKGRTVRYHIEGQVVYAAFINLVRGGVSALKNALLRGGGLCLNSLSSSLRKSSCRVRERGFNTQSVHHLRRSTSLSLKTMRGTLLRPVRTVTLRSQETPRVSFWKFPQAARDLLIAEHLRGDTSFLSQKVSHSHTWCHLIQLLTRFSLSQCRLKTNSAVGGASC